MGEEHKEKKRKNINFEVYILFLYN